MAGASAAITYTATERTSISTLTIAGLSCAGRARPAAPPIFDRLFGQLFPQRLPKRQNLAPVAAISSTVRPPGSSSPVTCVAAPRKSTAQCQVQTWQKLAGRSDYVEPPRPEQVVRQTFCGNWLRTIKRDWWYRPVKWSPRHPRLKAQSRAPPVPTPSRRVRAFDNRPYQAYRSVNDNADSGTTQCP
jgi:hypothetical protein